MKYMMFVVNDGEPDTDEAALPDINAWVDTTGSRGQRIQGSKLAPANAATTVRVRKGKLVITDGPFVETREVIVGFDLLECADLDEAIRVAQAHPMARAGRLELRPLED
jgi:hypothetical protein